MRIDILTLFPQMVEAVLSQSIIGRARQNGLVTINCVNIRDFTLDKHSRVDDYPYGGGSGMILQAEPVCRAFDSIRDAAGVRPFVIYLSPQGRVFRQETAKALAKKDHIVLLCGHYEGIDERIIEELVDIELSIGDYVLTGGEIPAMAVCDSICRMLPGVLSSPEAFQGESHYDGLLEYPQYTRPPVFRGRAVPQVLLSGDHGKIKAWRDAQSLERTKKKRPDMLKGSD